MAFLEIHVFIENTNCWTTATIDANFSEFWILPINCRWERKKKPIACSKKSPDFLSGNRKKSQISPICCRKKWGFDKNQEFHWSVTAKELNWVWKDYRERGFFLNQYFLWDMSQISPPSLLFRHYKILSKQLTLALYRSVIFVTSISLANVVHKLKKI